MKILVLGGTGMLGHKMFQYLRRQVPDTWCTVRCAENDPWLRHMDLFTEGNVLGNVNVADFIRLEDLLMRHQPEVVINCVGVVKQRSDAKAAIPSITINALLPHKLAELMQRWGGRLIHFSTDCVFSGRKGDYSETDPSDAEDLYGKTKYLGEVATANALTLRTSIIGREITHFKSLVEWFLAQKHQKIMGYTRAFYSGVTTNYMAALVGRIIREQPGLNGLHHVTSSTINKYELLLLLREAFSVDVEISPDDSFFCNRSMCGHRFVSATGFQTPPWSELVAHLRADPTPYENWRSTRQTQ
jgi:dTDP-4-dehydrorhamnose reductase